VNKLRTTGLLIDIKQKNKRRVFTEEKLDDIWTRLEPTPGKSLKRLAQETGVSKSNTRTATQLLKLENLEWELAGETEVLGEDPPRCHLVHHKSHMTWNRNRAAALGIRLRCGRQCCGSERCAGCAGGASLLAWRLLYVYTRLRTAAKWLWPFYISTIFSVAASQCRPDACCLPASLVGMLDGNLIEPFLQ
jgi:hypothetical protein